MPMTALWLLRLATWLALEKPPPPPETVRVATIAYPGGSPSDYGCKNDFCAFDLLIRAAKDAGAGPSSESESEQCGECWPLEATSRCI